MDHIVLDIETQYLATDPEVGGWSNFHACKVACAGLYEFQTRRMKIFGHTPPEVNALRQRLERADRISGYNIRRFDLPVIYETPRDVKTPCDAKLDDLFERILLAAGRDPDGNPKDNHWGWGLANVAAGTLGMGKLMSGAEAPKMFHAKRFAELYTYCIDDVALERDLCVFMDRYGFIVNAKQNVVVRVPPWLSR